MFESWHHKKREILQRTETLNNWKKEKGSGDQRGKHSLIESRRDRARRHWQNWIKNDKALWKNKELLEVKYKI